jgi:hypothetical protein
MHVTLMPTAVIYAGSPALAGETEIHHQTLERMRKGHSASDEVTGSFQSKRTKD